MWGLKDSLGLELLKGELEAVEDNMCYYNIWAAGMICHLEVIMEKMKGIVALCKTWKQQVSLLS